MTIKQYKNKLIAYLKHNIILTESKKAVARNKFEYYCKDENFDFQKIIDNRADLYSAKQKVSLLKKLISDINDGTVELTEE